MIGKGVITEVDITLDEAKSHLEKRKKDGELSFEQKQTFEYLKEFSKRGIRSSNELIKELTKIENIDRLLAVSIADNNPTDVDDLKLFFEKKRFDMPESDLKKILDLLAKHSK